MQKKEKYSFQSETKQLLHLMIHSLYSNKEIFIRELISNASDAIDKMKFKCLSDTSNKFKNHDMRIRIQIDKKKNTIIISDNGIGMTKDDVIQNLGTIANSGTKKFLQSLSSQDIKNNQLIGQFGVGFYSSFIVANKVTVKTRYAEENNPKNSILWESEGKGEYSIQTTYKEENGTEVEIHLKNDEKQFLEEWKINEIIKKYSDHISIAIEIQEYDEKNKILSWKQINTAKSIWTIPSTQISDDEYKKFYQYLTKDINEPLSWIHNKVEGTQEYTNLLYIPKKSQWNIWDQENKKNGLKLYVKKIYIMDDVNQFLPNYLRFIKGIIDTNNLPLNISREILQESYVTKVLKKALTKKILKLIQKISIQEKEKYKIFWKEFGNILKEGIAEDLKNQSIIAGLLRFSSMKSNSQEQKLSLKDYIKNMHTKQNKIYFVIAENYNSAKNSPYLEIFKKHEIDVLLLSNHIDEWMMNYLTEFENKKFQSINKIDDEFEKIFDEKINQKIKQEVKDLLDDIKNILKNKIHKVNISHRLFESPVVLVSDKNTMSKQMSKLFEAAGQKTPPVKYTLEINPKHKIIKKIMNMKQKNQNIDLWINILFEQSLLAYQGTLENPNEFIKNINKILIQK
ncbi:molecular chaperone HtpG [Buchnera aphidicola]|uniref:molecular chaperone HtpG n=1 Tax=Buchnera aphidicola TaxID=9 RepID=UPI003463C9FA